jgi:hypothetical protein
LHCEHKIPYPTISQNPRLQLNVYQLIIIYKE